MTLYVLGVVFLFCLGMLLGAAWTTQALQPKLRQEAQERRRLNEEWAAIHTVRGQRGQCPRCAASLSEKDWYFDPTEESLPTADEADR